MPLSIIVRATCAPLALLSLGAIGALGCNRAQSDTQTATTTTTTAASTTTAQSSTPASVPAAAAPGAGVDPTIKFAPSLGVNLGAMTRTTSGLAYQDKTVGTGAVAAAGQSVTVHYTGWLPNGTKFDSSRDHNQPFTFALGAGQVIPGWDEGVAGMHVGGRRLLVIPPALGYGPAGSGPIPPNATLVFDVELLAVH